MNEENSELLPNAGEPKLTNRFVVRFPEEFEIQEYNVNKLTGPRFKDMKWHNINIFFVDIVLDSTAKKLLKIVEVVKNKKPDSILFTFFIDHVDPTGVAVETWAIDVADIPDINFGTLDYAQDELLKPSLTIVPFDCRLL